MDIRAILLDFDGTALQQDQTYISFRNMIALDKAMKRGIEVIPSTGRVEDMFPPQIEADPRFRYWVTSNGGRVVDRQTREVIFQSVFTPEESAEICKVFEGQGIYGEIAAAGKIYMENDICQDLGAHDVPPHHVWYLALGRQIGVKKLSDHFLKNGIGIEKVNLYNIPKERQQPLIDALNATGLVSIFEGAGKNIQFFPVRQNRDHALEALFERLGIGFEHVMALGDSTLDMPAISKAGIGVAMGNSPQWVKDEADFIARHYTENGVAQAIEKYLL